MITNVISLSLSISRRVTLYIYFFKNIFDNSCSLLFCERAFSKLIRIKNKYRTSQTQKNLDILMILYSENDLLKSLNLNEVPRVEVRVYNLASSKTRKKMNLIK